MYVKRVVLENVRGFEKLDFNLERPDETYAGWTVVTGDNGSGKSTFLKAISLAIAGPVTARILQPTFKGWIRSGQEDAVIAVEVVSHPDDDSFTMVDRATERAFWAEFLLTANGIGEPELKPGKKYTKKGKTPARGPWADAPSGWFACGYGPFRRLSGASADAMRLMAGPSRVARFVSMFREDAALSECERWLMELHNRSRDGRQDEADILSVIRRVLDDDFLQHGMKIDRIDSEGLWLRDASGIVLPLLDMSDGYRAALAILTDLCRHTVGAYGLRGLVEEVDGHPVINRSGLVLIDEIDAHLHPEWQREIGFWLKKRFPEVQFIVASHSPIICQAADPGGLFRLPPPGSSDSPFQLSEADYQKVIKAKPDTILLSPAFGLEHTRSPRAVAARQRHADLRAKQRAAPLATPDANELTQLRLWVDEED